MSVPLRITAIVAGVGVYLLWATLASALLRRRGRDLSQMHARSSPDVLLVGGIANLLVLASVLLLTAALLGQPLRALVLRATWSDLALSLIAVVATFTSA